MGPDTPPFGRAASAGRPPSFSGGATAPDPRRYHQSRQDPLWVRIVLTTAALIVVGLLIVVPVVSVFVQAFSAGVPTYIRTVCSDPNTRSAILLTLTVAPTAVALNVVFGVAAAWAIARFRFPGRALLLTLIDLPFSVSPVVAGLIFVLLFGLQGYFGVYPERPRPGRRHCRPRRRRPRAGRGRRASPEQRRLPPDPRRPPRWPPWRRWETPSSSGDRTPAST